MGKRRRVNAQPGDVARKQLCDLIAQHGESLCDDSRRCEGFLRDACAEHKREVFALVNALKEGVATDLRGAQNNTCSDSLLASLSQRLHDNLGLDATLARWAVDSWAMALGKMANGQAAVTNSKSGSSRKKRAKSPGSSVKTRQQQTDRPPDPACITSVNSHGNTEWNGEDGLLIQVAFEVTGMRGGTGQVAVFFYHDNETPLLDTDGENRSADGQVAVWQDFNAPYETTVWNDFRLFIPHSQLHLSPGQSRLKFVVMVFKKQRNQWYRLTSSSMQACSLRVSAPTRVKCQRCKGAGTCQLCHGLDPYVNQCHGCRRSGCCPVCKGGWILLLGRAAVKCGRCQGSGSCQVCHGLDPYANQCSQCQRTGCCPVCKGGWILT